MKNKLLNTPRVINEFEGGPTHLYLGKGPYHKFEGYPYILLYSCKDHQIFRDQKITPTIESIYHENMPLVTSCEECEECCEDTCPKPIEEVGQKGSGVRIVEMLEGWFVDLGKCTPWKACKYCNSKGYLV